MSAIRPWSSAGLIGLCLLTFGEARAGPPFRTDDPEPVATGHFELFTFSEGLRSRDHTSAALPGAELNYGLIPTAN